MKSRWRLAFVSLKIRLEAAGGNPARRQGV